MNCSDNLVQLLTAWEGISLTLYKDSGGEPTIGIGHLLTKSERASGKIYINSVPHRYSQPLTFQQCKQLLLQDLKPVIQAVSNYVTVPLTQNQFDSLVSFTFNVGINAFINSTLLKVLNNGQHIKVPEQMRRWVHDNGKVVQGLVNRRRKEIKLFTS